MRLINLNPNGMEAVKIIYPGVKSRRAIRIEYMRFIPHSGEAKS